MAEYYRSLDDANAYFDDQLYATDWTGATDANKIKALIQAARTLDSIRYKGWKAPVYDALKADRNASSATLEAADASQSKQWPRDADNMRRDLASTVQTIKAWATSPSSGNFTLTIILADGTTFTTGAIAFDANAAAIQSAIDTAAAAALSAYTAGDIAVTGGALNSADVVLTFSGNSVKEQSHNERPTVTPDSAFTTNGGVLASPAATVTVTGECPDRIFWAQCEEAITLISGRDPKQEWENAVLTSDAVSSTRTSSDRAQSPPAHTAHMFTSALAWKYIRRYVDSAQNTSFRVHRTGGVPNVDDNDNGEIRLF